MIEQPRTIFTRSKLNFNLGWNMIHTPPVTPTSFPYHRLGWLPLKWEYRVWLWYRAFRLEKNPCNPDDSDQGNFPMPSIFAGTLLKSFSRKFTGHQNWISGPIVMTTRILKRAQSEMALAFGPDLSLKTSNWIWTDFSLPQGHAAIPIRIIKVTNTLRFSKTCWRTAVKKTTFSCVIQIVE